MLKSSGAEVDNVGESGEESEEEWNYYRVEPTGEKASAPQDLDSGASEDMESQLNPNAAVFIPSSPTENSNHIEQPFNENLTQEEFFNKVDVMSSSFIAHDPVAEVEAMNGKDDEVWLSSSPKKGGVPLDNVCVPPEEEFDREVSQRPGDLDVESHNAMNGESVQNGQKIVDDLLAGEKETVSAVENLNPFAAPVSPKPCLNLMDSEFSISGEENGENVMIALEVSPPVEPANEIPLMEPANEIPLMEPGNENPFMEPVNGNPLMEPPNDKAPIEPLNEDSYVEHVNQDSCMEAIMEEPVMESGAEEPIEEAIVEPVAEEPVMESCNEPILETVEEPANEELVVQSTNEVQFEGAEVAGMTEFEQIAETVVEAQPDAQSQIIPDISEDAVFVENAVAGVDLLSAVEECNGNFDTSPIVSSATGFGEHLGTCTNSSHVLSFNDISSEPLNDAVIYSTSGFDNMMSAPSRNVDSAMERASAQSTPFEGEPFDFEAGNYGKKGDQPNQEEPNVFTQLTEVEIHSHFDQEDDLIGDVSAKSELNHRFTEDSAIIQSQEIGGGSQFPVMSEIQGYTFAENQEPASKVEVTDIPEVEVIDLCEEKVDDFSSQQGFNESQSPVVTRTQEFVFGENQEPTVSTGEITDIPKAEGIINSYGEEIDSIVEFEPSPAVNGSESPDVVVPATPVPENPIEKESASELHLDSSAPEPIAEEQVVEIEPKIETEIAEQIAASTEAEDNTNQAASIAAVGAAAAAAIGVAATVAASKTDKKPGSKAPITKAKPLPASKAPAKPSTKAGAPTSTTAPKRPAATAPPVPAARAAPRTTAATKPKPSDSVIKSSATAGPKPAPPKPRTTVSAAKPATTDKKPLTNGDLSKAATAPKPTARPSTTRPLTAPARTSKPAAATSAPAKTAATATAAPAPARPPPIRRMPAATTTAATAPKPKPAVPESKPRPSTATGVAAKSRPATTNSVSSAKSSVASARAAPASKPVDKQTKETTNKLISATRSTVSRTTTASKTTASKTLSAMTTGTAKPSNTGKPVPIKKVPATSGSTKAPVGLLGKKPIEKPKAVMTNGNLKNGHASPEESPVQNGVSHDEPVMEKKESDLKVESLIDNQLVA